MENFTFENTADVALPSDAIDAGTQDTERVEDAPASRGKPRRQQKRRAKPPGLQERIVAEPATGPPAPDWRSKPRTPRPKLAIKPGQKLLFKYQVLELLDMAYPTLWAQMRDGKFPLPIALGPPDGRSTKIAWLADEVYDWIASRPRRRIGRPPRENEYPAAPVEKRRAGR